MAKGIFVGQSYREFCLSLFPNLSGECLYKPTNPTYSLVQAINSAFIHSLFAEKLKLVESGPVIVCSIKVMESDDNFVTLLPINYLRPVEVNNESALEKIFEMHEKIRKEITIPKPFDKLIPKSELIKMYKEYKDEFNKLRRLYLWCYTSNN